MYSPQFYITNPVWNNEFDFEKRINKSIYVPKIINGTLDDLKIWYQTAFEIVENWEIKSFVWLKNFIRTDYKWIPVIIVDNHNHVFYFWFEALFKKIIKNWINLVHIDEHSDIKDSWKELPLFCNLKQIFEFTNFDLNVGNYIRPAISSWLISNYIKISWEEELINYKKNLPKWNYILNLDMDFFSSNLDYIDYKLKKEAILNVASHAKLITIATSPYFIDQEKAIKVIKDIF